MNIKNTVKVASLSMSFFFTVFSASLHAKEAEDHIIYLAGELGANSSASARITLIIPPPADQSEKVKAQKTNNNKSKIKKPLEKK